MNHHLSTRSISPICRTAASLLAILILCSDIASAAIVRGPYVQNLKPNSAIIVWRTDTASASEVQYGLTTSYGNTASDATSVLQHAVTLTGLSAGQVYHYRVVDGGVAQNDLTFRSGKDATYNSFTFAATGDHRSQPAAHLSVAQRIAAIDPEFVIDSGDLTNSGDIAANWDTEFFTPERDVMSRSCFFPCIGNHEGTAANYLSYFYLPSENSGTERYYSFDYANAHFIVLDNYSTLSAGSTQYNWFVSDLQANQSKKWLFVSFHIPPYSSGNHGNDAAALAVRSALCPLMEQYDVDMVLNGHDHDYEHSLVNGVHYVVTGGGGAPLYPVGTSAWTVFSASSYQCCKIVVTDNQLNLQSIKPDGTVLESFSITQPSGVGNDWVLY